MTNHFEKRKCESWSWQLMRIGYVFENRRSEFFSVKLNFEKIQLDQKVIHTFTLFAKI